MIYFDNSATTMPDDRVLDTFIKSSKAFFANPSSLHRLGIEADRLLGRASEQVAELAGMPGGKVVFTSGGTEADNLALFGLARGNRSHGKKVLVSAIEHPAVLQSLPQLEAEGFEVDTVHVGRDGVIDLADLDRKLTPDTSVVSIMHVNNETGAIQPLEEAGRIIRAGTRAIFHSDTVQSFGKIPIPVNVNGPDAISLSAHKIHGIEGSGALILKKRHALEPILFGGGQQEGFRSGTVPVAHAAALAKAMRLAMEERDLAPYEEWRNDLVRYFATFDKLMVLGAENNAPHILSVAIRGIKGEIAVNALQEQEIYVSTSSACSSRSRKESHVLQAMGVPDQYRHGVIRISFGRMNSAGEIDQFKKAFTSFMETIERV